MAISTLIVAVRTTGAAGLTRLAAGFTAARTSAQRLGTGTQNLTRGMFALQRQVSSVAGAYQDVNGLWRTATGALLTQRHTVTTVTTGWGRLAGAVRTAGRAMRNLPGNAISGIGDAISGMLPMLAKWSALLVGIAALLVPLVPVVTHLSGSVLLLAPAVFTAVTAFAALKLAFHGVGDAIKAGLAGSSKEDLEKFHKALAKLSPAAREFAVSAVEIVKAWRPVQKAVQEAFFGGGKGGNNLAHEIRQLSIEFKPLVMKWLPQMAQLFGNLFKSASDFLTLPSTKNDLEGIFRNTHRAIDAILGTFKAIGRAIMDITAVAAPRFANMTEGIEGMANKFAKWIKEMRDSGKLTEWIDNAKKTLDELGGIAKETGRIFQAIFKGGDDSEESFLKGIRDSLRDLADWAHGEDGQNIIKALALISAAIVKLGSLTALITNMTSSVHAVKGAWMAWGDEITSFVKKFYNNMIFLTAVVVNVVLNAFSMVLNGAAAAFSWVPGLGPKLQQAATKFQEFRDKVNNYLAGLQKDVNINVDINYRSRGEKLPQAVGSKIASGNIRALAGGGPFRRGETTVVGEDGPELVTWSGSGRVHSNRDSTRMLSPTSGGSAATQVELVSTGGGGPVAELIYSLIKGGSLRLQVRSGGARVGVVTV